jgi:hypothetical protein
LFLAKNGASFFDLDVCKPVKSETLKRRPRSRLITETPKPSNDLPVPHAVTNCLAHKDQSSSRKARRILLDFGEIQTKSFEVRERERTNEKLRTGN